MYQDTMSVLNIDMLAAVYALMYALKKTVICD